MLTSQSGDKPRNVVNILRGIYKENGIRGVFAGFVPRVMWITIGGAIFFGSYDLTSKVVTKQLY